MDDFIVKTKAASIKDTTGGCSSRTCSSHIALEMLSRLFATSSCKFFSRSKFNT